MANIIHRFSLKLLYFIQISLKFKPELASIGSDNGLAPNKQQVFKKRQPCLPR